MKKPSLEEVKEYFKNADTVECNNDYDKYYLDLKQQFEILSDSIRILNQADDSFGGMNSYCQLWTSKKGYAKILTYKNTEPKFEITKEQILNLHGNAKVFGCSSIEFRIKEWFPEVFENQIPTKTIQEAEELLKELGHNFKIV